jgi:4-amino-4-deoxy-L-arabinose transferase-like glycosyltransferase/lipoprotein NlpI
VIVDFAPLPIVNPKSSILLVAGHRFFATAPSLGVSLTFGNMAARVEGEESAIERRGAERADGMQCLPGAAIVAATFLIYTTTLRFGFVGDDHVLIVANDAIRSWRYLPSYFASHLWSFRYPHLLSNAYRPMLLIWLRLNDALFSGHAWGWHLSLVLAHVAVTYLVYRLALRLTRDTWTAVVAGLVFGLHPVHVETVAEAAWADQPLSALFMLGAILAWRSDAPGPKLKWMAASLALCAAALLSKESALLLPFLVGGCAWIYADTEGQEVTRGERFRLALTAAAPFGVVTCAYVPLRIWALKGFTHTATPLAFSTLVFTIPSVLLSYVRLLVWPSGLSCYYDTPYIPTPSLSGFVLPSVIIMGTAAALAFWYGKLRHSSDARAMAFAILWMALGIMPVLNFRVLPEGEILHDRYVYLSSVGFAILVALGLRQASGRAEWRAAGDPGESGGRTPFGRAPVWGLVGAGLLSVLMGFATIRQSLYWADDLTLNHRAHEIAPHNVSATTSLAAAAAQHGLEGAAMVLYQQALAVRPGFWRANVNLAYLYYARGDFAEAARYFERACASDPADGDQFLYLGMSLLRMGRLREAEEAVRAAFLVRPNGKNYHLGLGMVLTQEGRLLEAKQQIETELAEDPRNAQAQALLKEVEQQIQATAEKLPSNRPPEANPKAIR